MALVLFSDKDGVLKGYTQRGVDTWALFQGKDLLTAGSDLEDLTAFLDMLENQGIPATYTLKVYSDVSDPDRITSKTENNGAFSFKLNAGAAAVGSTRFAGGNSNPILARLENAIMGKVEKMVDKMLSGELEEEKEPSLKSVLMGWLEEPAIANQIIGTLGKLIAPGAQLPGLQPAVIGNVRHIGGAATDNPELMQDRLVKALDRLGKCDPDIIPHLEKLADVAEKNPAMYKTALGMLKTL